jgi:hypothetical protein
MRRAFGMIQTWAAVPTDNKLGDGGNCHRIVQSWYKVQPQNSPSRLCVSKVAASLPSLVVEAHGQAYQNGRRLSQAEGGRRGSGGKKALRRQLFIVGYLQFVERKHLHAALCSTGYRAFSSGKQTARSAANGWYRNTCKAPSEMAAMSRRRKVRGCIQKFPD